MISRIIQFSVNNKFIVLLFILAWIGWGGWSLTQIPIGAVPDITNNQVQVLTTSRNLSTQDIEQFITYPIELEMANLPGVKEIRSISKFGLSVVTIVFEDKMGTYLPRQLIAEKIKSAQEKIPEGYGTPEMGPITTGLGEIYQYILDTKPGYKDRYSAMDLRTIQDWIVKRQLSGIPGVVEVNTWGGFLKQYEVAINPEKLRAMGITLSEVYEAVASNNDVTGGGYIEKGNEAFFIRGEGMVRSLEDIRKIVVKNIGGVPVLINDLAEVGFGSAIRFGAITGNGEGEKVLGQVMMLKGASTHDVINRVKERVAEVQEMLPEGVYINPFLERTELIDKTTFTISENLTLGALIVIFVLVLLLGNLRAGLIVASVIPLSLLFGIGMMNQFGLSANLMSLGAIDFGIIIDGAVIIIEYIVFKVTQSRGELSALSGIDQQKHKDRITAESAAKMMKTAFFGQIIILIVFVPILSLTGVEGKMFKPMALSFSFALIGAMILSLTFIPAMASLVCQPKGEKRNLSDRIMDRLRMMYKPTIQWALDHRIMVVTLALVMLSSAAYLFTRMGGEFIPTLDEGDFVVQPILKTGTSLTKTVETVTQIEKVLLSEFPEVDQVVTRIGAAEVPTDPMSMEETDVIIKLRPKGEWAITQSKDELADRMKAAMSIIPGIEFEFTQPIEMRFNELITGVRADVAIKIYGEDLAILERLASQVKGLVDGLQGAADVTVEKVAGLPQMAVEYNREKIAQYDLSINELNKVLRMAFSGSATGVVFEGERRFDLVVRLDEAHRKGINNIRNLYVDLPKGGQVPLREVATITNKTGPAKISRDNTQRRIVVGINVRNRDMESLVDEIRGILDAEMKLPFGYFITYGGQFENLQAAMSRLRLAVPIALFLIFLLLYFTFQSFSQALMVFTAIPLSAIGGVWLLWLRDMPFSISAGVGFIALFGVAVLNGIVLIDYFNDLKEQGIGDLKERVIQGTLQRLRPVLLTASAAALGFFPMAFSTSAGAEVQRPLATVVIGGLITATLLTLIVLPVIYTYFEKYVLSRGTAKKVIVVSLILLATSSIPASAQETPLTREQAIQIALENNLGLKSSQLQVEENQYLENTGWDLGKTTIYYGYDENNLAENGNPLDVFGIQQSIPFPTSLSANTKVKRFETELARVDLKIQEKSVSQKVSLAFEEVLYHQNRLGQYEYLDSLYGTFAAATERRFELGESNYLEKLTAEAKYLGLTAKKEQVRRDIEMSMEKLKVLLQTEESVKISNGPMTKLPLAYSNWQELSSNHEGLNYQRLKEDRSSANLRLSRNQFLPDLNIEYFRGYGTGENAEQFNGYQFGLSLPLFFNSQRATTQSLKIGTERASTEMLTYEKQLQSLYIQLIAALDKYDQTIEYYEDTGLKMADELQDLARKSYLSGESGYLEYVQSLDNARQINLGYLDNLFQYNRVVLEINYLIPQIQKR